MYKDIINDIRNIKDLETIINYYYPNQLIKNRLCFNTMLILE